MKRISGNHIFPQFSFDLYIFFSVGRGVEAMYEKVGMPLSLPHTPPPSFSTYHRFYPYITRSHIGHVILPATSNRALISAYTILPRYIKRDRSTFITRVDFGFRPSPVQINRYINNWGETNRVIDPFPPPRQRVRVWNYYCLTSIVVPEYHCSIDVK